MSKRKPLEGTVITGTTVVRAVAWLSLVALSVYTFMAVTTALNNGETLWSATWSAFTDEPLIWIGTLVAWMIVAFTEIDSTDTTHPVQVDVSESGAGD